MERDELVRDEILRGDRGDARGPRLNGLALSGSGRRLDPVSPSTRSVIVAGARTPIGKFRGAFAAVPAVDLGAHAIRAAVERAGIAGEQVDYAIVGHVLQAGAGQITSLQASIGAGLPKDVPAITINKVCLSSMSAIAMADQMIRSGEIEVAVAGGMESMTNAPYVVPTAREGSRLGDAPLVDTMIHDGLWSSFRDEHMGAGTDEVSAELGLTREEQDRWAARSHRRADEAWRAGPDVRGGRGRRGPAARGRGGHGRPRRGDPARHDGRAAGRAAAGVPAGRHDHRGERVADLRRRVRGRRDERREGGGARRRADRRDRGLRDVVGSVPLAPHGARDGAGARAQEGAGTPPPISGSWRSTRRSPRSRSTPRGCSASTRTS